VFIAERRPILAGRGFCSPCRLGSRATAR